MFDLGVLNVHTNNNRNNSAPTMPKQASVIHKDNLGRPSVINIDVELDDALLGEMRRFVPDSTWEFTREVPEKCAPLSSLEAQKLG